MAFGTRAEFVYRGTRVVPHNAATAADISELRPGAIARGRAGIAQ